MLDPVGLLVFEGGVGGVDFVALLELRPFIPIGAGNNVHLAIVVEIADGGALGPELVGGPDLLKAVEKPGGLSKRRSGGEQNRGQKNSNHVAMLGSFGAAGQAG